MKKLTSAEREALRDELRDEFAKAALPPLIEFYLNHENYSYREICDEAYVYANEMLNARDD